MAGDLIADAQRDGARVIVAVRIRHHAGLDAGPHQSRAARGRPARRAPSRMAAKCSTVPQSRAFAVADHQIAHVYVAEPEPDRRGARIVAALPGVERVLDRDEQRALRARSSALRRARRAGAAGRLVHLLLLARRPPRAGLRAPGRDPSQARLRPGRAVRRSGDPLAQARRRLAPRPARARLRAR